MAKDYCPACQETVEYELSDGDYYCSICGRTKGVAEETAKYDRRRVNRKRLKVAGVVLCLLLSCWWWTTSSREEVEEVVIRGTGYTVIGILLSIGAWIFYRIKAIIKKKKLK